MNIAIQLEKIHLSNDRLVFKPIGIIKGFYDDEQEVFVDEYGYEYDKMSNSTIYCDRYFCAPTTIQELREAYGVDDDDNLLIEDFLDHYMEICYVGYFDYSDAVTKVIEINFSKIESMLPNIQTKEKNVIELDSITYQKAPFDIKTLQDLKDFKTLDEIRAFIDKLIDANNQLTEMLNKGAIPKTSKVEQTRKPQLKIDKKTSTTFNLKELREEVSRSIVGQEDVIKDFTRVLGINQTSIDPYNKSHILITGPSGTGKTAIVNLIAKELDLPTFKADATAYTKAGYKGKDVPTMLTGLVEAAGGDIEKAQNGLLIIDEIDKACAYKGDEGFGKSTLYALLKILDREVIEVDTDSYGGKMLFDTSNLTVIFMGSFEPLYQQKLQEKKPRTLGFISEKEELEENKVRIEDEDLISWMGPEFIGRIGCITSTNALTEKEVLEILKKSKLCQLNIAKNDLANRGIKLLYTSGYLREIAKRGYSRELGARQLNKTVKKSLDCAYDEILTNGNVKVLKLTKKTALNNKEYHVEY
ncbi:MAG: AAA family ATPase [Bacilli bacterium]|nr:AAA family ATPase [Bacilli bacterium]